MPSLDLIQLGTSLVFEEAGILFDSCRLLSLVEEWDSGLKVVGSGSWEASSWTWRQPYEGDIFSGLSIRVLRRQLCFVLSILGGADWRV